MRKSRLIKIILIFAIISVAIHVVNRVLSFHLVVNSVIYFSNDGSAASSVSGSNFHHDKSDHDHHSLQHTNSITTNDHERLPLESQRLTLTSAASSSSQHLPQKSNDYNDKRSQHPSSSSSSIPASCKKKMDHIIFLKTHKCGSSTVQNIFLRFGDVNNLFFVLPRVANYLGHPSRFSRRLILDPEILKKRFNLTYSILAHHTRFNYKEFMYVLPPDSLFITIVRNPISLFESLYSYYELGRHQFNRDNMSINEFAQVYSKEFPPDEDDHDDDDNDDVLEGTQDAQPKERGISDHHHYGIHSSSLLLGNRSDVNNSVGAMSEKKSEKERKDIPLNSATGDLKKRRKKKKKRNSIEIKDSRKVSASLSETKLSSTQVPSGMPLSSTTTPSSSSQLVSSTSSTWSLSGFISNIGLKGTSSLLTGNREESGVTSTDTRDVLNENNQEMKRDKNYRYRGKFGRNQMSFDLGFNERFFENPKVISNFVDAVDSIFSLVMISERMDESLVLMKHLLCWSLEDVVVFRHNSRNGRFVRESNKMTPKTKGIIRKLNLADSMIYNHFSKKFDLMVKRFGVQKMRRQVSELRNLTDYYYKKCVSSEIEVSKLVPKKFWSNSKVMGFKIKDESSDDPLCERLTMTEMVYTEKLRKKQQLILRNKKLGFNTDFDQFNVNFLRESEYDMDNNHHNHESDDNNHQNHHPNSVY